MKITAYHGSKNKFNKFDISKIGLNGTSEGKGIYFTDNKQIASGYAYDGYLYTVKLHMKESLTLNEKRITKSQLKKLLLQLHKLDQDFLSNWGEIDFEGFEKVLDYALENVYDDENCDVEMISGLANTFGSVEIVNKAVYDILGYDSIIAVPEWQADKQTLYIALVNDIIEILDVKEVE